MENKKKASKYDDKIAIKGGFNDVFAVIKKNKEQKFKKKKAK